MIIRNESWIKDFTTNVASSVTGFLNIRWPPKDLQSQTQERQENLHHQCRWWFCYWFSNMFECILYMYICTMVASCQYLFNQNVSRLWQEMVWRGNLFQNMLLQRLLRWTRKRFISLLTIISMWFLNSFAINNFFHIHQKLNLYHRRKCLNRLHQRPHGEPSQCQRLYFLYIYLRKEN